VRTRPTAIPPIAESPLWELYAPATPRLDAIEATPAKLRAAQCRVTWDDFKALLDAGIPAAALLATDGFSFGVARLNGRRMLVTQNPRLRAYLNGPGLFDLPEGSTATGI